MGRPTYMAYAENIKAKTGRSQDDFWKLANRKGFVKRGKFIGRYSDVLRWLKSDMKLGHVHASFVVMSIRLRARDPTLTGSMKRWALATGYKRP
jgi:hypothetical protein